MQVGRVIWFAPPLGDACGPGRGLPFRGFRRRLLHGQGRHISDAKGTLVWGCPDRSARGAWLATHQIRLPALLETLLRARLIAQVMEHVRQPGQRVGIMQGLCQHLFVESPGLAQFPLVTQHGSKARLGRQIVRDIAQNQLILGSAPLQGKRVLARDRPPPSAVQHCTD